MNLRIIRFSILSPHEEKAFDARFHSKMNVIIGKKDTGKSSLARSILYTFGCDVKDFDFLSVFPNNIYLLEFEVDNDSFILIRKRLKKGRGANSFKIIKNKKETNLFFDTKSFKEHLCKILNVNIIVNTKSKEETKLYPNHIFLPFYTDQDNSWQNYLSSTFTGINFIENYRKVILEYFTGVRSNEYYRLQLAKNKIKHQYEKLDAFIDSKEKIMEENNSRIEIIENIDIEVFKEQYQYFLSLYNDTLEYEQKMKTQLNKLNYERNSYLEMAKKLHSTITEIVMRLMMNVQIVIKRFISL